jgi:hypothetical protein
MLRHAHFDVKGGLRTFAASARALGQSGESGRSMRGQIHKCCKRSNGGSEPEVTDAVALTKVRFFQLRSISIQQLNYLFEKAGFLLGLMLSNKTALL